MRKIMEFKAWLIENEKSRATVEKYVRDVRGFLNCQGEITKEGVLEYKEKLKREYRPKSVNSILSAVNCYLDFIGKGEFKAKLLKLQKRSFAEKERVLTKREYERLVEAAKRRGNERLYYLLQTIAATGIRVSEVKYITAETLKKGVCVISLKGKIREIFIPKKLCRTLLEYAKRKNIKSGRVFITKNGKPLDRTNIWAEMKRICKYAKVDERKVFPHNLRHLFARCFYEGTKDLAKLADILGHSSVNTTRIYLLDTGEAHKRQIEKLKLLLC